MPALDDRKKVKKKEFSDVKKNRRIQWHQFFYNKSKVSSLALKYQILQPWIKGLLVPFSKFRACPDLSWIILIHPNKNYDFIFFVYRWISALCVLVGLLLRRSYFKLPHNRRILLRFQKFYYNNEKLLQTFRSVPNVSVLTVRPWLIDGCWKFQRQIIQTWLHKSVLKFIFYMSTLSFYFTKSWNEYYWNNQDWKWAATTFFKYHK